MCVLDAAARRAALRPALYAYYGARHQAFGKFANYIGKQRALSNLVNRIVLKKTDVIIVGADFGNASNLGIRGHTAGAFFFLFYVLFFRK